MKNLAIIPARGGSKRIPKKNIKQFFGVPIIAYSIKAAKDSGLFDEIMVSTDDTEIAKLAQSFGAKIPFMRSKINADDIATVADAVIEVLKYYSSKGEIPKNICCLFPTAPLIKHSSLIEAYQMLSDEDCDSIVSVQKFSYPIQRAINLNDKGYIEMIYPEFSRTRSQDLPALYHDAGQFYWAKTHRFIEAKRFMSPRSKMYVLSELEAHDIDNEEDWQLAEMKYKINLGSEK